MNLSEISWPVFRLGSKAPEVDGDVTYYYTEYQVRDESSTRHSFRVIDDKSIPGDTLGQRRLAMANSGEKHLARVSKAIYFTSDLIKLADSRTWFIDNSGKVFKYRKLKTAKLTCHRIKKVLPINGMGAIVEVEGILTRFKTLYSPSREEYYAGILTMGIGHILYGFYTEPFKSSHRRV